MNWFLDEFDEDEKFVVFEVDIKGLDVYKKIDWEIICKEAIHPKRIKLTNFNI